MHCIFMCALVYNMMCVACCVHLCMIGYIYIYIYIYRKKRTLELESMIIGDRELLFISGWHHASRMTYGIRNLRFGA